jgi:hypothetical protein
MNNKRKLGIFLDHAKANIIELENESGESRTIELDFSHAEKEHSLSKSEHLMHNKEYHKQTKFFKKLEEVIRNYDEVLLFGPTDAKVELYNLLKEDHLFAKIKIEYENSDKLTDNQQHAFIRDYFQKN